MCATAQNTSEYQGSAYGLRRIPLPRTPVNKGKKRKGRSTETRPHTRGPSACVGRALRRSWRSSPQADDAPTATVAPHQEGHDECPHSQQKQAHQFDDRWNEALVGHYYHTVVHERSSGNRCYHSHPAWVDAPECDGQAEQEEGQPCKEEREAVHRYLGPPNRLGCCEGGWLLSSRSTCPSVHRPL